MSFVLNDVTGKAISEKTRRRVRTFAHELRYRPNAAAKLLRTNRSHAIGFITDEIASTPFAGDIIKGAQEAAWQTGKILTIVNTGENLEIEESAVEMMLERQVEGIIFAAMYHRAVKPPADSREVPTVLLNCFAEDGSWASVVPDEVSGGRTATDVLLRNGHRRVGFINFGPGLPATVGRLEGYKRALEAHDLTFDDSLINYGYGTAPSGYRCATELMRPRTPRRPSSAATTHGHGGLRGAQGARPAHPRECRGRRLRQPQTHRSHLRPPLSTIALPHYEMGQRAVNYLIEQVKHGEIKPVQHTVACPYVGHESV